MKIITFLFANARSHRGKSIGFITTIILLTVLSIWLFFVYRNIDAAVRYYSSSSIVDKNRVEITADNNILTLFSRDSSGIQEDVLASILQEKWLHDAQIFTLIEYPVLAKFSLFSFGLETDIPVFALSWGTLHENEIGISRKMIDYYNTQFAGSTNMFPEMNEKFLIGQPVTITVGGSKLFNVPTLPATPIQAHISSIHSDYPGFGLVLREDILRDRLAEIGQSLGNPYKITAYMKNLEEKNRLKEKYKNLHLTFDNDKIEELETRLTTISIVFLAIFIFIWGVILMIIIFLLGGIFRESVSVYRIIHTFGIYGAKSRILTLWEPILLMIIWLTTISSISTLSMSFISATTRDFVSSKWLIFPIASVSMIEIGIIILIVFVVLITILGIMDEKERRKFL